MEAPEGAMVLMLSRFGVWLPAGTLRRYREQSCAHILLRKIVCTFVKRIYRIHCMHRMRRMCCLSPAKDTLHPLLNRYILRLRFWISCQRITCRSRGRSKIHPSIHSICRSNWMGTMPTSAFNIIPTESDSTPLCLVGTWRSAICMPASEEKAGGYLDTRDASCPECSFCWD